MPRSRRQNSNYLTVVNEMTIEPVGLTDKAICDDCGQGAQIVVSELVTRGVDVLCWQCLMNRAMAVAAKIALAGEEDSPNA